MKLNQLRALAAVAETGSIQEASRILHLTQPALSKAIKELESSVGATLFVRSSKGVQLTPSVLSDMAWNGQFPLLMIWH